MSVCLPVCLYDLSSVRIDRSKVREAESFDRRILPDRQSLFDKKILEQRFGEGGAGAVDCFATELFTPEPSKTAGGILVLGKDGRRRLSL